MRRVLRSNAGFTYIAALFMVVIAGIMATRAAEVWKTTMQREREAELIFRGLQIRDALRGWYGMKVDVNGRLIGTMPTNMRGPDKLEDLVKDPRSTGTRRYLRKKYPDPMIPFDAEKAKEPNFGWVPVRDANQRIVGVKSSSEAEPIKQGNFQFLDLSPSLVLDLDPKDFEGKKKYSEWIFDCTKNPPLPENGGHQNLPS